MPTTIELNIVAGTQVQGVPYFTGDSAEAPPLPRVGETVNVNNHDYAVTRVTHNITFDQNNDPSLDVVVTLS